MDSLKRSRREIETHRSKTLMRRLIQGVRARLDEELRPSDLTAAQVGFLKQVDQNRGATGAQLARACFITPQSAQTMMALAVGRGWIVRGKNAENGRLVTVRLTAAGARQLKRAQTLMTELELAIWHGTPVAELRVMNEVLERGLKNLEDFQTRSLQ